MLVFRYLPKENDWRQESSAGPCAVTAGVEGFPCDSDTIQLAHGVRGARDDPVVLARGRAGPSAEGTSAVAGAETVPAAPVPVAVTE